MGRDTYSLRLDDDVDEWLDQKADEWNTSRSEIANRALKVYGGKIAKGSWKDPKFKDQFDEAIEEET